MSSIRPSGPWLRTACCLALAGCGPADSITGGRVLRPDAGDASAPAADATLPPGADAALPPGADAALPPGATPGPCGRCGLACAADQYCIAGVCTARTDGAARPLAPESLGRVTSQRPAFRWVLPQGVGGARFQLCRDRLCRDVAQSVDLEGETFRPAAALAPGVYFWRVLARRGAFVSDKPTPVWEFVVGARDRGTDTVLDRIQDYNGDGYADLALRLSEARPIGVYHGGGGGLAREPASRITLPTGEGLRAGFSAVGDLNGDGFPEALSVVTRNDDPAQRTVNVYRGGPAGLSATPAELPALAGGERWPDGFTGAGDVNGDGYGDVAGTDRERDGAPGRVRVFFGGPGGLTAGPGALVQGAPGDGTGVVSGNGDVNGDGRPDLLVGQPSPAGPGRALVWLNGAGACLAGEAVPLAGDAMGASLFGHALSLVGDVDGDGRGDPLVTEPYAPSVSDRGRVLVFPGGGAAGVGTTPARTMPFRGPQMEFIRLRTGGDFNGDGYDDLVAWMHNEGRGPSMYFYYGGPGGLAPAPARVVYATDLGSPETALSFAWSGDSDRDGYDDLVMALQPTEWFSLRGSAEGLRLESGPRLALP